MGVTEQANFGILSNSFFVRMQLFQNMLNVLLLRFRLLLDLRLKLFDYLRVITGRHVGKEVSGTDVWSCSDRVGTSLYSFSSMRCGVCGCQLERLDLDRDL